MHAVLATYALPAARPPDGLGAGIEHAALAAFTVNEFLPGLSVEQTMERVGTKITTEVKAGQSG